MARQRYIIFILLAGLVIGLGLALDKFFSPARVTLKTNQPVLAIVIDDFGGADTHGVAEFMAMDKPITMAVMPNLVHSVEHSEQAHKRGHEVILHQPMEPDCRKASWLGPGAILSSMTDEEIKANFVKNLKTVPHAKGFNNHTGSKITSDAKKIKPILEVAKSNGLFVLDSCTSAHSQVISVAKNVGIPYAKRDVFLDNIKNKSHIQKQIKLACKIAKKQGYAVAIGHVGYGGKVTAGAVLEAIPEIEKEGVKLVHLSEIIRKSQGNEKI